MKGFEISGSSGLPITFDFHFANQKQKSPLIIFLHGFKGFKDWGHWPLLAEKLAGEGFHVLRMNFSHNGVTLQAPSDFSDLEAFGTNTFSIETQDVQDVLNFIENEQNLNTIIDFNQINLLAHSRGGAIALVTANEDPRISRVATLSGVGNLVRYSEKELAYWKDKGVLHIMNGRTQQEMPLYFSLAQDYLDNEKRFAPHLTIQKIKQPYLIIHAEKDETVLLSEAEQLNELGFTSQLVVIENANHSFDGGHPFSSNSLPEATQKSVFHLIDFFKS